VGSTNASQRVLHLLGYITSQTSLGLNAIEPLLTISGTTVTATRQFTGNSMTVGFLLLEFQSAALNGNVQSFQKTWTNSTNSTTQVISSVNSNHTLLIYAGSYGNSTGNAANIEQRAFLTNATSVTIGTNSAGSTSCAYNFFVVEFAAGVLAGNVQRNTTTLAAVSSNTSTITSVNTSMALINFLRYSASQASANIPNICSHASLTNGTTVTVGRHGSANNVTGSWEVAEFN
jgi:hypothetical protein